MNNPKRNSDIDLASEAIAEQDRRIDELLEQVSELASICEEQELELLDARAVIADEQALAIIAKNKELRIVLERTRSQIAVLQHSEAELKRITRYWRKKAQGL